MIVGYNRERSEQSQLLFVLLEWLVMCNYTVIPKNIPPINTKARRAGKTDNKLTLSNKDMRYNHLLLYDSLLFMTRIVNIKPSENEAKNSIGTAKPSPDSCRILFGVFHTKILTPQRKMQANMTDIWILFSLHITPN